MVGTLLELDAKTASQVRRLMACGYGETSRAIRLTLDPSAPVKEKYQLEFIAGETVSAGDIAQEIHGLTFVFDKRSAELIRGSTMEYVEGLWNQGFRFKNPNRLALMAEDWATKVQETIDARINPAVAVHRGVVTLVDVREGIVYLEFGGGCKGCGLAPVTIRSVVERQLREVIPEIRGVVDLTDHAAGEHPYA